ncbi:MAG: aminoacyltransferase, partial [Oscillospiraceae bacterium]|nr:aminoacyltransferase [Oscillospiraceae bacterium]
MEILDKSQYHEYESFVRSHPNGEITQSTLWHSVKSNWLHEIAVVRDDEGKITAGVSILIRKIPVFGISMLYAPRGPVCDLHDADIMAKLKQGVDLAAKKHRAYVYKLDPNIHSDDERFISHA